jgi:hypothetical protein
MQGVPESRQRIEGVVVVERETKKACGALKYGLERAASERSAHSPVVSALTFTALSPNFQLRSVLIRQTCNFHLDVCFGRFLTAFSAIMCPS